MNYFFGFNTFLANEVDWMFNLNHLFLILALVAGCFILYFLLSTKSAKGIKITKLCLAGVMAFYEFGRIIWKLCNHIDGGGTFANFNWWWNISFQMCAIMSYLTIAVLIASAFTKKENRVMQIFYNILFGVALVGGILTFVYPDFIDGSRSFLHFSNFQSFMVHMLLIFIPIYLIKVGDLKVQIKNIWMPLCGFIGVGSLAMMASQFSGQNFAFALKCGLLDDIGLNIPFPWHYIVTFLVVFLFTLALYGGFELVRYIKNRKSPKNNEKQKWSKSQKISLAILVGSIVINFLLIVFIPLGFNPVPIKNALALLCLLPMILQIVAIYFVYKVKGSKDDKHN